MGLHCHPERFNLPPVRKESLYDRSVEGISVDFNIDVALAVPFAIAGTDKCDRVEKQRVTDDHNHDHDDVVDLDEETAEALREIAQSDLSVSECAAAILRANE